LPFATLVIWFSADNYISGGFKNSFYHGVNKIIKHNDKIILGVTTFYPINYSVLTLSPMNYSVKGVKTNGQWRDKFSFFHFCPHFKSLKHTFTLLKWGQKWKKKISLSVDRPFD
jgi:hypothetical protein